MVVLKRHVHNKLPWQLTEPGSPCAKTHQPACGAPLYTVAVSASEPRKALHVHRENLARKRLGQKVSNTKSIGAKKEQTRLTLMINLIKISL
jgi:hypothetical protein